MYFLVISQHIAFFGKDMVVGHMGRFNGELHDFWHSWLTLRLGKRGCKRRACICYSFSCYTCSFIYLLDVKHTSITVYSAGYLHRSCCWVQSACQSGQADYRAAWTKICDVSRREFAQVYNRLDIQVEEKVFSLSGNEQKIMWFWIPSRLATTI